jgi:hypothetical protein
VCKLRHSIAKQPDLAKFKSVMVEELPEELELNSETKMNTYASKINFASKNKAADIPSPVRFEYSEEPDMSFTKNRSPLGI